MATKKRGLGKGLEALFDNQVPVSEKIESTKKDENGIAYIDINYIKPNENQPRKHFDEEKIEELSQSILEHGIIQPLVVRKIDDSRFEIVAGERRYRASRKAGLKKVPAIVREFTDEENMVIAIIENMQREDLNPIEEAEGLKLMIDTYGFTQEQVSKTVSKSRPYITNSLRLLNLPGFIQKEVQEGRITTGHGKVLLGIEDENLLKDLCNKIVKEDLSVRKLEELIASKKKKTKKPLKKAKNPDVVKVERDLKDIYGTKVTISPKGKKGVIELEYYSQEDLNRIIDLLKKS